MKPACNHRYKLLFALFWRGGWVRTKLVQDAGVFFTFIRQVLLSKQESIYNLTIPYQLYHLLLLQVEEQLRVALENLHSTEGVEAWALLPQHRAEAAGMMPYLTALGNAEHATDVPRPCKGPKSGTAFDVQAVTQDQEPFQ